jgi:hypothetical protein
MANAPVALAEPPVHLSQNQPQQPQAQEQPQQPPADLPIPAQHQQQQQQPTADVSNTATNGKPADMVSPPLSARSKHSDAHGRRKIAHLHDYSEGDVADIISNGQVDGEEGDEHRLSLTLSKSKTADQNRINNFVARATQDNTQSKGLAALVESTRFNLAATLLILLNAVYIGLETDINPESKLGVVWLSIDMTFGVLFSLELILRIKGLGVLAFFQGCLECF